jgi:anti-sigma B factor antagonist
VNLKLLAANVRAQSGLAIIDLSGEIDSFAEQELNRAYDEAEAGDPRAILLNFSEVNYINSTGIALIVSLLARARKGHRRLITYGLSAHYVEIFEITRLADFMTLSPNEESAMASAVVDG